MTSEPDRWAALVAASCPLSSRAALKRRPDVRALEQLERLLRDTLGILGIIEDGGIFYVVITAKKHAALGGDLNSLASRAAHILGFESGNTVPHGHIYAVDDDLRPVGDWRAVKAAGDALTFCRLFRIRALV